MKKPKRSFSRLAWYGRKYGFEKGKKGNRNVVNFVFTMNPLPTGWLRYPLVAKAIIWNFFYEKRKNVWRRGIRKWRRVVVFFDPQSHANSIAYEENISFDLSDKEKLKEYWIRNENKTGAFTSRINLYFAPKPKKISEVPSSVGYSDPENINELLMGNQWYTVHRNWKCKACRIFGEGCFLRAYADSESDAFFLLGYDGTRITADAFDRASSINEELCVVRKTDGTYRVLDIKNRKYVDGVEFNYISSFRDGHAWAEDADGNLLILDENCHATKPDFSNCEEIIRYGEFFGGISIIFTYVLDTDQIAYYVKDHFNTGCVGYCNSKGEVIAKPQYIVGRDFHDGLAFVCRGKWYQDRKWDNDCVKGGYWSDKFLWGAIDASGKEVIPCRFSEIRSIDGSTEFLAAQSEEYDDNWGIIDRKGQWIVEPIFETSYLEHNDGMLIFFNEREKISIYDLAAKKFLLESNYSEAEFLDNGYILAQKDNDHIDVLSRKCEVIFSCNYDQLDFKNGYFQSVVRRKGKSLYGIVGLDGNTIIPCIFKNIDYERNIGVFEKDGKCGLMNLYGEILLAANFDEMSLHSYGKRVFIKAVKDEVCGIYDFFGREVIPCSYDEIRDVSDSLFLCRGKNGYDMLQVTDKFQRTYEKLTDFIVPLSHEKEHGKWHTYPIVNNTMQMPWVEYSKVSTSFLDAVYDFMKNHQDFNLYDYQGILKENNIEMNSKSFSEVDLHKQDGRTVMAMIVALIRNDRFCEGVYLDYLNSGFFVRCLKRLKEIDEG